MEHTALTIALIITGLLFSGMFICAIAFWLTDMWYELISSVVLCVILAIAMYLIGKGL